MRSRHTIRRNPPINLPLGYTRDWCSEGDSNTHHRRSERRVSADWTTGAVLAGGIDPPASVFTQDGALPNERSDQNGAPCMESNLRPAAYKAAALPAELRGRMNPLRLCPNASIPSDVVSRCT